MNVQYKQVVIWDDSLIDVGFVGSEQSVPLAMRGLACNGVKITTGAPTATAGQWIPGAIVSNAVDGQVYINTGSTATPVWTLIEATDVVTATTSLSSAQILALNGTPITLVAAPGSGKIVVPISVVGQMTFSGAAYTTNTTLQVKYAAGADALFSSTTLLPVSAGVVLQPLFPLAQAGVTGNDTEYVSNAALVATVAAGNPAAGSGTLKLYTIYKIITL